MTEVIMVLYAIDYITCVGVLITSSAIFNIILTDFYVYSIPKAHICLYVKCQGRQF